MGADRWAICPRCTSRSAGKADKMDAAVKACYGKVSAEAYMEALTEAQQFRAEEPEETLREDFEIGIDSGDFSVSYSGHCDKCGLHHRFKHEEKVS